MCVEFYKMDYSGWYPPDYTNDTVLGAMIWVHRLKPYFARAGKAANWKTGTIESMICCPSRYYTNSAVWSYWWNPTPGGGTGWFHLHYGIHGNVSKIDTGTNESMWPKPSNTILLFDYGWYNDTQWDHLRSYGPSPFNPDGSYGYMRGVSAHNGGINVLWCDGHASWQSKDSLKDSMFTGLYTGN